MHNGGPIEPEQEEGIAALKRLYSALGKLIQLAEAGQPLGAQLSKLRQLKNAAFKWSAETYGLTLANNPLVSSSMIWGAGIAYVVNVITKDITTAGASVRLLR